MIVAVVVVVLIDLVSLNLLTGLARALPVERRVRSASRRAPLAPLPGRLRQLESLLGEFAKGDPVARSRVATLLAEISDGGDRGAQGPANLAQLQAAVAHLEELGAVKHGSLRRF